MIFIWIDIETTGLNRKNDSILEIYLRATTRDTLEMISEFHSVLYVSPVVLENMDSFCTKMHTKNGLVTGVKERGKPRHTVSDRMEDFFKKLPCGPKNRQVVGRNVDFDTAFLFRDYSWMQDMVHYQRVDLSAYRTTLMAASEEPYLYPSDVNKSEQTHRAKQDIVETIEDFKHLRKQLKGV